MIKFLDLQKINAQYSNKLKELANEVIDNGWYLLGSKNEEFERNLSKYLSSKHVIACANGLDALRLIIRAYKEIGLFTDGDEIIVPANTYIASILAITDNSLVPVFIEPDEDSYNINISLIEKHISNRTKAIMVVHLYGQICWSEELENIANRYKLKIIEDNAQAIGAKNYDSRLSGNLGDAAGFSFYPGKNLGALGDSGAISTNDDEIAQIVRIIANYGSSKKYFNEYSGLNSRMDEIQAAFLNFKLGFIDKENEIRRKVANYYIKNISNPTIILPKYNVDNELSHVWHLFVIRCNEREKLQQYLSDNGIQTLIHYPIPSHKQKAYQLYNKIYLPVTEKLANEILSLPIGSHLEDEEVMEVCNCLNSF